MDPIVAGILALIWVASPVWLPILILGCLAWAVVAPIAGRKP